MLQSKLKLARISYMTNESFILAQTSPVTGNINEMEIPMSIRDYSIAMQKWKGGALIQEAFPNLPAPMREFIMSGISPKEWADIFGMGDDEVSDEGFDPYSNSYTNDC